MNTRPLSLAAIVMTVTPLPLSAQEKSNALAKDLIGTWVLVGTPDKVGDIPASGGRMKYITATHWTVTQADPTSGLVIFHHGGPYTLKGDEYVESVKFANQNTASLIGNAHTFKLNIEGDTLTQIGVGNPWTEVWKRMK
jgi:hypothetical protein